MVEGVSRIPRWAQAPTEARTATTETRSTVRSASSSAVKRNVHRVFHVDQQRRIDAAEWVCPLSVDDVAYITFTSGTTGAPKATMHFHRDILIIADGYAREVATKLTAAGIRVETAKLIEAMLERGVLPVIPGQGSVGASGDLAPLAHMAAVMLGSYWLPPGYWTDLLQAAAKAGVMALTRDDDRFLVLRERYGHVPVRARVGDYIGTAFAPDRAMRDMAMRDYLDRIWMPKS